MDEKNKSKEKLETIFETSKNENIQKLMACSKSGIKKEVYSTKHLHLKRKLSEN